MVQHQAFQDRREMFRTAATPLFLRNAQGGRGNLRRSSCYPVSGAIRMFDKPSNNARKADMSLSSLDNIGSLPALPYVAHEILLAVNDGEAHLGQISAALAKEPGLTARIIAMANSAFFAGSRAVYSVEDAVVRLGLNRVRVLAASILLAAHFDSSRCRSFRTERYWYEAMGAAFAATRLVRHLTLDTPDDAAYLAGLLHNIGLLLLAYVFPTEMGGILAEKELDPGLSLSVLERQRLGCDHHEAGQLLLRNGNCPPRSPLPPATATNRTTEANTKNWSIPCGSARNGLPTAFPTPPMPKA